MARATRSSRLDLRIAPEDKELIDRAATLSGINTADFIRSTLVEAARNAIRNHEVITLTVEEHKRFVDALINPPEPSEELRALIREFAGDLMS